MIAEPAPSDAVQLTAAERVPAVAVTVPGAVGNAHAAVTARGAGRSWAEDAGGRAPRPILVGAGSFVMAGIPPRRTPGAGLGFMAIGWEGRAGATGTGVERGAATGEAVLGGTAALAGTSRPITISSGTALRSRV